MEPGCLVFWIACIGHCFSCAEPCQFLSLCLIHNLWWAGEYNLCFSYLMVQAWRSLLLATKLQLISTSTRCTSSPLTICFPIWISFLTLDVWTASPVEDSLIYDSEVSSLLVGDQMLVFFWSSILILVSYVNVGGYYTWSPTSCCTAHGRGGVLPLPWRSFLGL